MSVSDWSTNADLNTSIDDIDISEHCPAKNMNDAVRAIMANVKSAHGKDGDGRVITSTYAVDSGVVHKTGDETIGGTKVFSGLVAANNGLQANNVDTGTIGKVHASGNAGYLLISGGSEYDKCSRIELFGENHAQYPSKLVLTASGSSTRQQIWFDKNGHLAVAGIDAEGLGFPSASKYINIAGPVNNTVKTYTPPADGWIVFVGDPVATIGSYIVISCGRVRSTIVYPSGTGEVSFYFPVSRGYTVEYICGNFSSFSRAEFVYSKGAAVYA